MKSKDKKESYWYTLQELKKTAKPTPTFAVDIEGNGVHRCFARAFLHQSLTHSEMVSLADGWEVTVRHVRLLQ